jgi:hypothetical protein
MMSTVTRKLKTAVSTLFSEIPRKISPTNAVLTNISVMRSRMRTAHTASFSSEVHLIAAAGASSSSTRKYVFNNMNVEDYNDPWLNDALHAEGVDTGNPYLDDLASEDAASYGISNSDDDNTASGNATYIEQ